VPAAVDPVRCVDLNADLGEETEPEPGRDGGPAGRVDEALLGLVTTTHVACGFHAGGPEVMRRTVAAAVAAGVVVGAHPSYPDPEGFGRRPMDLPPDQVADDVLVQLEALGAVARAAGTAVRSVKPHGALYHRVAVDEACAGAVAAAVAALDRGLVVVLPAGALTRAAVEAAGVGVVAEGFCDRGYRSDGTLATRSAPGGLVTDPAEAARRAVALATGGAVTAVDGSPLVLACRTVCVHGDTPGVVAIAPAVRRALAGARVNVAPYATPGGSPAPAAPG
jgi:5-oxoprolinase (ATP-hydrolysing) subunit A